MLAFLSSTLVAKHSQMGCMGNLHHFLCATEVSGGTARNSPKRGTNSQIPPSESIIQEVWCLQLLELHQACMCPINTVLSSSPVNIFYTLGARQLFLGQCPLFWALPQTDCQLFQHFQCLVREKHSMCLCQSPISIYPMLSSGKVIKPYSQTTRTEPQSVPENLSNSENLICIHS